jgi:hypothetical protein
LCHIAPGFGSSARRIEDCISGYVTFNATKADEPKTKQDGAIIFCRGPKPSLKSFLSDSYPPPICWWSAMTPFSERANFLLFK